MAEQPRCVKCGSKKFSEHAVHHGQSIRRDCASCGHTLDFVRWYGQREAKPEPPPGEAELAVKKRRQRTVKPKQGSLIP